MLLHERIKFIRDSLDLSRSAFGKSLGVSGDTVNNWERDRVEIKDYILNLICKTFRVNYFWLTEEKGEPFIGVPDIIMDDVIEEYGLDDTDRSLIEEYVKLPPSSRTIIKEYLMNIFKKTLE